MTAGREQGLTAGREEGLTAGREEGLTAGLEQGQQLLQAEWEAWLQRWKDAQAEGKPFDEPPPQLNDK